VLARPERLLEAGEDPRDGAPREAADDLLHARLEHPDVRLARVHVGCARLEGEPLAAEALERLEDERGLADPRLADEQDRARRGRRERAGDGVDGEGAGPGERRGRARVELDDAPELAGRSRRRSSSAPTQ
jgi:hypothetical protein